MSGWRTYLAPAVLLAVAIGAAVLIVQVGMAGFLAASPRTVLRIAPNDPDAVFRQALLRHAARKAPMPPGEWNAVAAAFAREPLADAPFVLAVLRQPTRVSAADTALLEEARRRNPRNRAARAMLLEQYARSGRIQDVVVEATTLNRLVPNARGVLVDALAAAMVDPVSADAVFRTVRDPETLDALLVKLVANGTSPATILRLSQNVPARPGTEAPPWQSALIAQLVSEARYGEARLLWRRFSGLPATAGREPVFNGGFVRPLALPPFDWRLATSEVGASEVTSRRTLSVEYFGRQSGELAGQLLTLAPGRYRLTFQIEGKAETVASKLVWYVRCDVKGRAITEGRTLLTGVLNNPSAAPRTLQAAFTVPSSGCGAQWLTLEGVSAEFPTSQSVELRNLRIVRADQS